jgi:hypothetical protein
MRAILMGVGLLSIALMMPAASAAEGTSLSLLGLKLTLPVQVPLVQDTNLNVEPLGMDLIETQVDGAGTVDVPDVAPGVPDPLAAGDALRSSSTDAAPADTSGGSAAPPAGDDALLGGITGGLMGLFLLAAIVVFAILLVALAYQRIKERRAWAEAEKRYGMRLEAEHRRVAQHRAIHHAQRIEERQASAARAVAPAAPPSIAAKPAIAAAPVAGKPAAGVERAGAMRPVRFTRVGPAQAAHAA